MRLPAISAARAREVLGRAGDVRVLVVGDVMLDRFVVGNVTRISPEAPVPVVRFQSEHTRLGGAANVAQNLAALGAQVSLVGIVGSDRTADRLRQHLAASHIGCEGLIDDPARPTVEKVRIVTERNQQVARIDYEEDADAAGAVEQRLAEAAERLGARAQVLLVSDYLKGTVTQAVMSALVGLKRRGAPLLVDPKIPHLACYAGATLVTPNTLEAEIATNRRIRTDDDAREAALAFRTSAQCDATLITRGEHGMWLSSAETEGSIPSVAREVSDVTGAGDTVVATLAVALAAGASLPEAAVLANYAAGVVVGKFGPATLTPDELVAAVSAGSAGAP
jgi:D-beta-D-heptose 7-phosphate kinase/D-beta-D-heptose 1-phosphate adenosyltransferase